MWSFLTFAAIPLDLNYGTEIIIINVIGANDDVGQDVTQELDVKIM